MIENIKEVSKHFEKKLKKIKIFLFDIDGVLTNGQIYYAGEEVGFNRFFHAKDGYGLVMLKRMGFKVGVITGGFSVGVEKRFKENLKLDYVYTGNEDKRDAYNEIKAKEGATDEEILYMGDEFFDIPLLKKAGFSATVPATSPEIQEASDYVTKTPGGMGAVREVIDMVRFAQDLVPEIPDFE